ncbi:MAG: hypothetical protein ACM34I_07595 [bacterium]
MELDVRLNAESMSIPIGNPYRVDLDSLSGQIQDFAHARKVSLDGIDLKGLIPQMIKGIAGCEKGCPANAKSLVSQGFKNFNLLYIEGGILSAKVTTVNGTTLELKLFPEF